MKMATGRAYCQTSPRKKRKKNSIAPARVMEANAHSATVGSAIQISPR